MPKEKNIICEVCGTEMEKRYERFNKIPGYHKEVSEDGEITHMLGDHEMEPYERLNNTWDIKNPWFCPTCNIVRFYPNGQREPIKKEKDIKKKNPKTKEIPEEKKPKKSKKPLKEEDNDDKDIIDLFSE